MNGLKLLIGSFFWSSRFQAAAFLSAFGPTAAIAGAPVAGGLIGPTLASGAFFSGGGGLLASLSTFELISGAFSGFSALSSVVQGNLQSDQLEIQARQQGLAVQSELLAGREAVLRLQMDLTKTLAANRVAAAASGLATGFRGQGSVQTAEEAAIDKSQFEQDLTREGAEVKAASKRLSREALVINAKGAKREGLFDAVGTIGDAVERQHNRGLVHI